VNGTPSRLLMIPVCPIHCQDAARPLRC